MRISVLLIGMILLFTIPFQTQAMIYSSQEIAEIADFYSDKPGTFIMVGCCPVYTYCCLNLVVWAGEKYAPSFEAAKTSLTQCLTSCGKRVKKLPYMHANTSVANSDQVQKNSAKVKND